MMRAVRSLLVSSRGSSTSFMHRTLATKATKKIPLVTELSSDRLPNINEPSGIGSPSPWAVFDAWGADAVTDQECNKQI